MNLANVMLSGRSQKKGIILYDFYKHKYNIFSTSKCIETESRLGGYQGMGSWGVTT